MYLKSEFNEIEVKRVVYRTGENEYYLNNTKVRLKDITDLFIDSGASRDAYNIISQGTVEDIVSSKPEARRVIIEEAAGVLKYKKHKEESLRKLEKTKDNLNTINLLINELETSLEPLRIQSIKAKKFNEYKDDLKNLEIALIVNDIKKINLEYNKLKQRNEELKSLIEELTAKINKDTATLEVNKLSNLEVEGTLNKLNQNLVDLEREIAETNAKKTMILERKKLNSNNDVTLNNVLNLKEEILNISKNIKTLEEEIKSLNSKKCELKTNLDSIDNEDLILRRDYVTESNEYNQKNKELLELNNKIDILNNNILNEVNVPLPVKSILNNPRLKGIYNTVGKLLTFDDLYMNAIETTLGASLNYLVVDNETSVKQAINYLKEQHLGRATFLPLNIIKPKYLDNNIITDLKNTSGFIDTAINLVKYDAAYDSIMQNLLATTIVVKDIDALNNIAKRLNYKYKVVSLDGDISYAGGSISGGAKKNSNSILKDRYELTKLETNKVNLETSIHAIETKINSLNQEQEEIKLKKNKLNNEYIELKETINRKNISLSELQNNYKDKENTIKNNEAILNDTVDIELDNILKSYYELNGRKDNLLRTIKDYKEKLETSRGDLAELELNIKNKNKDLNKYNSEFNSNEVTLGKYDVKLDNYLLTLNEEYTMTYEKALREIDTNIDIETTRLQVSKLKSSIKELGEVNLGSIAEFERVNERYTFLSLQKDDLVKSVEELETAIASLDEIMKERFKATFEAVNTEFQKVFKILFRGGEGHLELTDKDNLLETGVEIIAQPPGKKLSSITLFSGGERTLTAISLLFAILNVKTVPFVILDEVEAALDEANVDVFGKYLETRKDKSQFIIITHKKRTMEYADTLFGITMQEEGVSKLVSVRMEENETKDN